MFNNRQDAGRQLATLLEKKLLTFDGKIKRSNIFILSLLRGGIVIGAEIAKRLKCNHFPLVVSKIHSPFNEELAIGAVCYDAVYLETEVVSSLHLQPKEIRNEIGNAKRKFRQYVRRFGIRKGEYTKLKGEVAIIVDDGIATGSSLKAAVLFAASQKPDKLYVVSPVAPVEFELRHVDGVFILKKESYFKSVSQFYKEFPQVEDSMVTKIIRSSPSPPQKR